MKKHLKNISKRKYTEKFFDEQLIIDDLVKNNLVFMYEENDDIVLEFPHNLIPNIIFDKFLKQEKVDIYESFSKWSEYFYLINKHYFKVMFAQENFLAHNKYLYTHTIELLIKNKLPIHEIISLKTINDRYEINPYYDSYDFYSIFNNKSNIFHRKMLLSKNNNFDYHENILEYIQSGRKDYEYELFKLIDRIYMHKQFKEINYIVEIFCTEYTTDCDSLSIAMYLISHAEDFKIDEEHIIILNEIVFSNQQKLLLYFTEDNSEFKITHVILFLEEIRLIEFINNNIEQILKKFTSTFHKLMLLLIISHNDDFRIEYTDMIKSFYQEFKSNTIQNDISSLTYQELHIYLKKLLLIMNFTNSRNTRYYAYETLHLVINHLFHYNSLNYFTNFVSKLIFTQTKDFITLYSSLRINFIHNNIDFNIMYPIFKTSKLTFLIPPLYDTSGNSFAPFEFKLLAA